jgi:DNA mismatch repair protein MutS
MRALARIALQRGGPRDLAALGMGASVAAAVAERLARAALPVELALAAEAAAAVDPALVQRLSATLADELPLNRRDGGFVRAGCDASLDETRALRDAGPKSLRVQMDGGVAPDTAPACREHGCDLIVAASAIFGRGDYAAAIRALRA